MTRLPKKSNNWHFKRDRTLDLLMELGIMHIEDNLSGDEY